jgi:outer membrane receptor protein involved in Fe transport
VHGLEVWKVRGVVEYQLAESKRLLLDGSFATGRGPYATGLGALDMDSSVATLRLAYQSEDIRGHIYWDYVPVKLALGAPLVYSGIRLAEFMSAEISSHSVNADVQWTLPELWEPMLVIVGATGRVFLISSDQLLDADTFSDITSPDYHQPGIEHLEVRAGGFLHAEVAPTDLVTVTGGIRFDYNSVGGAFISPRLASVFRPASGQFLRLGVARAFRKPAFLETSFHLMAGFPDDSPITGPAQLKFQEFLTRVVGNNDVGNEELTSFEVGYLGQFLDDKLSIAVDLYCNLYRNMVEFRSNIVPDEQGLPDLDISSFQFDNVGRNLDIFGGELAVRYEVADGVRLLASWSHRQARNSDTGDWESRSPKNLLTLGGRFVTSKGLLGSLYLFSRSEFNDVGVQNPEGILAPYQRQRLGNDFLVLGKLGWKWEPGGGIEMETGVRLFLPVDPFSSPHFRYYEKGGGITAKGYRYGGIELARMVTGYLQGSF